MVTISACGGGPGLRSRGEVGECEPTIAERRRVATAVVYRDAVNCNGDAEC